MDNILCQEGLKDLGNKLSIIIPFHNASIYIDQCARSLLEQSIDGIELVFVNDCSTDDSVEVLNKVLEDYPLRKKDVKLITHVQNKGVASARNTGLQHATREFIGWCDADDWVVPDMFEKLLEVAERKQADLVWCNFFLLYDDRCLEDKQEIAEDPHLYMKGLVQGTIQGMLWNKVIRRKILADNNIVFLDNCNKAEDRNILFKTLFFCRTIVHLSEPLYYYVQRNPNSLTRQTHSDRVYEEVNNARDMANFTDQYQIHGISPVDLMRFKFDVKSKLLFSFTLSDFVNWKNTFPESNSLIFQSNLRLRHQALAYFANHKLWFLIRVWLFFKKKFA